MSILRCGQVGLGLLNRGTVAGRVAAGRPAAEAVGRWVVGAVGVWTRCTGERGRWPQGLGEEWEGERPGAGIL